MLLLSVATGAYLAAPLAVMLQLVWTRGLSVLTGRDLAEVTRAAAQGIGPITEALAVMLPVVLLGLLARVRRQWSATDLVLVGAAVGSGFALAVNLLRWAGLADQAAPDPGGGWLLPAGVRVPGLGEALLSLLPAGVETGAAGLAGGGTNLHLVWGAVAGLGVALLSPERERRLRVVGGVLLVLVVADHVDHALDLLRADGGFVTTILWPLGVLRHLSPLVGAAAVLTAVAMDVHAVRRVRSRAPEILLDCECEVADTGEAGVRPPLRRLLALARLGARSLPWSACWLSGFLRLRRVFLVTVDRAHRGEGDEARPRSAHRAAGEVAGLQEDVLALHQATEGVHGLVTRADAQALRSRARSEGANGLGDGVDPPDDGANPGPVRRLLTLVPGLRPGQAGDWRPEGRQAWAGLTLWCAVLLPVVIYLLLGGTATFAGAQGAVTSTAGFFLTWLLAIAAAVWTGWCTFRGVRVLRTALRHPYAEIGALTELQLGVGAGGVVVTLGCLLCSIGGGGAAGTLPEGSTILSGIPLATCLVLAMASVLFFPPSTLVELAGPGSALVVMDASSSSRPEFIASAALGTAGLALREATGVGVPRTGRVARREAQDGGGSRLVLPRSVQEALERSNRVGASARRIGAMAVVTPEGKPVPGPAQIIVFDETYPDSGVFHGHVRGVDALGISMRSALETAGIPGSVEARYEDPPPARAVDVITELNRLTLGPEVAKLLVGAAFHDPDRVAVQKVCLKLLEGANMALCGVAATCLGHLARIHGTVDLGRVVPALRKLTANPVVAAAALDALNDIERFVTDHPAGATAGVEPGA